MKKSALGFRVQTLAAIAARTLHFPSNDSIYLGRVQGVLLFDEVDFGKEANFPQANDDIER